MKFLHIEIKKDVLDLLEQVQHSAPEFDVYLGGGYLRDNYVGGLEPKDVDIFLIPKSGTPTDVPLITCMNMKVVFHKATDATGDMASRGVAELFGLYHHTLSTTQVQFIVYNKFLHHSELMDDMDMGINQVMYSVSYDKTMASDAFILGHEFKHIKCLHNYDQRRMLSRYKRMEAKFPDYEVIGRPSEEPTMSSNYYRNSADDECSGEPLGRGFSLLITVGEESRHEESA